VSNNKLFIVKTGTRVITVLNNIEGLITGVTIREERVTYEFCYFSGQEYKVIWLSEFEFIDKSKSRQEIGFK
jgi:hypothetical protein